MTGVLKSPVLFDISIDSIKIKVPSVIELVLETTNVPGLGRIAFKPRVYIHLVDPIHLSTCL